MSINTPALLMVAHGSRRQAANQEFTQQVATTAAQIGHLYSAVEAAFLELAEPTIEQGLEALRDRGHSEIYLLPCFLNRGRHVAQDIPEDIEAFRSKNPNITVTCLPYIGSEASYLGLLAELAANGLQTASK
ncbi:sirohydrochlorin chelatase [Salinibius halmophilus]|uniref:sirohydrochlorin chelatase n=1 Tax=Salinibius halmophilus TaxID=1853216 RepID=UPI000E66BF72|nr:CbiX/SirB N-terminal domain-containing protein [Salinibius halmophilus]